MATTIDELNKFWEKNREILFRYNGAEYFMFKQKKTDGRVYQVLCDDGLGCKSRVIETETDIFKEKLNGVTVEQMLRDGEIKYIY